MPRTRNIPSKSENNPASSAARRRGNDENARPDGDKENDGRAGRSTRQHRRPFGSSLPSGSLPVIAMRSTTTAKVSTSAVTDAKKKKPKTATKKEKLPLQDITSQFLPAPEAANRGVEFAVVDDDDQIPAPAFVPESEPESPLPPSSPPSGYVAPPLEASDTPSPAPALPVTDLDESLLTNKPTRQAIIKAWNDSVAQEDANDLAEGSSDSGKSDPFGFVSLERKLKAARAADADADADEVEDLDDLPVAGTDSPRPVRRLKRSFSDDEDDTASERDDDTDDKSDASPIEPPAHYATPLTPHKDKNKRPRLSHDGHDLFSPCTSSAEESPSPTKASSRKPQITATPAVVDPLDDFNAVLDRSADGLIAPATVLRHPTTINLIVPASPATILFPEATSRRTRSGGLMFGKELDDEKPSKLIGKARASSHPRKNVSGATLTGDATRRPHGSSPVKKAPVKESDVEVCRLLLLVL